jgi:prolipoprotein diacylglyceryltransferase
MFPVIEIGPLALQTQGLILIIGLWAGLWMSERLVTQNKELTHGLAAQVINNLSWIALVAGLLGARIFYIIRYPSAFIQSPISMISLNPGLLDFWGGIAAVLIAVLVYGSIKNIAFWPTLDAFTPAFAILTLAVHLSHLASGQAFGAPSNLPWAIELWGYRRHPTQIYASIISVVIIWAIWPDRQRSSPSPGGQRFLTFLGLSAGARLFLEAFRGDSQILAGGLRQAQVLAWLILAASLYGLTKIKEYDQSNFK